MLDGSDFFSEVVHDDLYVAEGGEVCKQSYLQRKEVLVVVAVVIKNYADRQPGREDGRVAAGDNRVAGIEDRVSREFFKQSHCRVVTVPDERAEMVAVLDFTRQSQIGVKQRDYACAVGAGTADYADDAVLVDYAEFGFYAVFRSFVESEIVERP